MPTNEPHAFNRTLTAEPIRTIDPRTGFSAAAEPAAHLREQVDTFRREWIASHPGANAADRDAAIAEYRRQLIQADPAVQQYRERATQAEEAARQEARQRQEASERRLHQEGAAALERQKTEARLAFLRAGGSAAEFEQQWPTMRSELLRQRMDTELTQRRAALQQRVRSLF